MHAPTQVRVFAPASISNIGPGFDALGLAVAGLGDTVVARRLPGAARDDEPAVRLLAVEGDGGKLPRVADRNTAGIAAATVLSMAGSDARIELELYKGMPIGTGLGSSAASAAAAACATNLLLGSPFTHEQLVGAAVEAEAVVSGRHGDNVAPSLLGGMVLVRSLDPPDVVRIPVPAGLAVVVVTPAFELSTRAARAALPTDVPLAALVRYSANTGALIAACHSGDLALLGRALDEQIIVPVRAELIPGARRVMDAATAAGAVGSSISGAGPSIFAFCAGGPAGPTAKRVALAMIAAFRSAGIEASSIISPGQVPGAREA